MIQKLKKTDGIDCVFTDKEGKEVSCFLPEHKIRKLIEDEAYERVTQPECGCSSCAVNNFCECDPINDGVELSHLIVIIDEERDEDGRFLLSYEERIRWFITNYYKTGMEYDQLLVQMKDQDLNKVRWYYEDVKIPKYKDEVKHK